MAGAVLYISYDGMLEPLGQSQVLGYLERLAEGRPIHLISFEKATDRVDRGSMATMRARLGASRINWTPLAYHKSPSAPATAFDIVQGTAVALAIARRHRIAIVHARSYVAGLIALAVKSATGARFLFDMRGFWADERVDGGLWPRGGVLHRTAKAAERRLLLAADHVVSLTNAGAREIAGFEYLLGRMPLITVIPTCADLRRFAPPVKPPAGVFTLGYVGSVGTWYCLDETLTLFEALGRRKPGARLLIVNRNEHAAIREAFQRRGLRASSCDVVAAGHADVPAQIGRMHAATAFYVQAYSKLATAPTKLAEYLGCGVPCVGNTGVGDMAAILEGEGVGVAISDFSADQLELAADRLLDLLDEEGTRMRCLAAAKRLFSLDAGVESYSGIYRRLDSPVVGDAAPQTVARYRSDRRELG